MSIAPAVTIDIDLLEDFYSDFNDAHTTTESCLIELESYPDHEEVLNALFRSVHTIKGNLIFIGFKDLTPLLQRVEDLLEQIRLKELQYDSTLSDLILLTMDVTKSLVTEKVRQVPSGITAQQLSLICSAIEEVVLRHGLDRGQAVTRAIRLLDPETELISTLPDEPSTDIISADSLAQLRRFNLHITDDLLFFCRLAQPIESRSSYWAGRSSRMLSLALSMNELDENCVDPRQLAAAVLMHDIGMAFLPLDLLHKSAGLSKSQINKMHQHINVGSSLLNNMQAWKEAALIISQHHEQVNGQGYPKGLKLEQISEGAKILAIADTFDAKTHERAYHTQIKRPVIRAVLEINRQAGSQFSSRWVDIFNQAVKTIDTPI